MMKLFKGRSKQTYPMKKKPIKEGYKFFALCDAQTGFVYYFMPSGLREQRKRTIVESVTKIIKKIPERGDRQYVVTMDNYFTSHGTMRSLRKHNLAGLGTARANNIRAEEIKDIKDKKFNTLYWINDADDYRIFRWIDNNVVMMVSTIHTGEESLKRARRKPRVTDKNKGHVRLVWGDNHTVNIKIPLLIDDYNHWMLGVDVADQLIAYYRAKIRCRRTWMPIMLQCMDVLRINSYIVYRECNLDQDPDFSQRDLHKFYLLGWISAMIKRARALKRGMGDIVVTRGVNRRVRQSDPMLTRPQRAIKKPRLTKKNCTLSQWDHVRFSQCVHDRVPAKQGKCKYCKYLALLEKTADPNCTPRKVKRPKTICDVCGVHLCADHFRAFHTP